MGVIDDVHLDVMKLEQQYDCASKSIKKRIQYDFDYLSSLGDAIDIKLSVPDYSIDGKDPCLFMNQVYDYLYDMEEIAEYVIKMFKQMNFYCYRRTFTKFVDDKKMSDLFKEFLEYFLKELIYIYEDLLKNGRILFRDLGDNAGESFLLNRLKSYYIVINEDYVNDMDLMETVIHELVHIYSNIFLCDYRFKGLDNLNNGFFGETLSLYAELSFAEFLANKNIFGDELLLHRNLMDFSTLKYFKTVNYLAKISVRENTTISTDNSEYEVTGKSRLLVDRGKAFFEYSKEYKKGSLLDFRYAMSSIDAYKLLERELSGENIRTMINDYLIGFQADDQMDIFLSQYQDFNFMYNSIDKRVKELSLKYPIPGYKIK